MYDFPKKVTNTPNSRFVLCCVQAYYSVKEGSNFVDKILKREHSNEQMFTKLLKTALYLVVLFA